jgi:hypothetical protein
VTAINDQLLNEAFELAYFILGDRAASIYVAMAAVDKLKAASTVQGRRQYYTPTGRSSYPATRTKVNLSEIHLLQRLIYVESELFERLLEEQQDFLHHEDLIIRYVKHLVRITTRHNSFYVALGLCRLLYNYTTSETAEIYNIVLQDPVRMRDDHYYRSRKKRLMEQMKDRFGVLIRTQRGFRREERFQTEESSVEFANLIKECLVRFMPWQSACVLPNDFDPKRNLVPQLLFEGTEPDKEHEIELNRIHTLTHPACLGRLTTALGIDPPERRLEVPHFFIPADRPPLAGDRFNPSKLTEGELNAIRRYLDKNSFHRRTFAGAELVCLIDQQRTAVFEPRQTPSVTFDVEAGAELLEVRVRVDEEEVPVALWPLDRNEALFGRMTSTAVLETGQKLTFRIDPPTYDSNGPPTARMTISYEVVPSREGILSIVRGLRMWQDGLKSSVRQGFIKPAVAVLLVAVFGAGLWSYFHLRKSKVAQPLPIQSAAQNQQENSRPSPPTSTAPSSESTQHSARLTKPIKNPTRPRRLSEYNATESLEETRGKPLRPQSITLAAVKRVFVDPLGEDQFSRQLRESLLNGLQSSNHFTVTTNRKEANAVFQGSVTTSSNQMSSIVRLELVDVSGQVIWSFSENGREFSTVPDVSRRILKALLRDVQSSRTKR